MSVTVIGDAFVDIIVPIQGIKPGETHHREIVVLCGGVANVAVQIAKLGETVKFVGKVGKDVLGRYFKENLEVAGVKDLTFVDEKYTTGVCVSLAYEGGERAMIACRGTNDYLTKDEISKCIDEILNSKIVYFSGYSLTSEKTSESVMYAIKEAHNSGCKIYFNPGAPNLIKPAFKKVIRDLVDVLILNFDEAKYLCGKAEINELLSVLNKYVELAVVTLGKDGCILCREGDFVHIPTEVLKVKDTTGAGDSFAAGFIVGKVRKLPDEECARFGNYVAAEFLKEKQRLLI